MPEQQPVEEDPDEDHHDQDDVGPRPVLADVDGDLGR